jgi:asparagine synthase (glutamine-hydrolysing)
MCGFAGEFLFAGGRADIEFARAMAACVAHRGPDERGEFISADGRCAIGFHRLAVIDPAGSHQPMSSSDGLLTVAFNGVIYNFRSLRQQMLAEGRAFHTAGDTEVLLHLYRRDGLEMLNRLDGMFAFAIYDASRRMLFLARDRLGEKPLWYAPLNDRLVFASEAKALLRHPMIDARQDMSAITAYLTSGYVPAPRSVFKALCKLPPASCLAAASTLGPVKRYWRLGTIDAPDAPREQVAAVRDAVSESVQLRLVSDVPLGALLSGGVDSSIVVGVMARGAGKTGGIRTFTAGFEDAGFDERPRAAAVAKHCGTDHTELLVQPLRPQMLDSLVEMFDEPFADSSALPSWLICRAAREHVKVALVGDGGDETFGGYDRYRAMRLARRMGPITYLATRLAGAAAGALAPHEERNWLKRVARFAKALPYPLSVQYFMHRRLFGPDELLRLLDPEFAAQVDLDSPARWFCDLYEAPEVEEEVTRAQFHDLATYLPDDLLVKSDTVSMACGLELRAPMLDHKVVELGLALPTSVKIKGRRGKFILRQAFKDMLPAKALKAPKRGFGVPLGRWLREELAGTLRETLLDDGLTKRRMFRKEALAGLISEHISGRGDHRHRLWALLVLARWLAKRG